MKEHRPTEKNRYLNNFYKLFEKAKNMESEENIAAINNCYDCLQLAVKWLFSNSDLLEKPWNDELSSYIGNSEFKNIIGDDLVKKINYVEKLYYSAERKKKVKDEQVELALDNLACFLKFLSDHDQHKSIASNDEKIYQKSNLEDPLELTEFKTRKIYIDTMLEDAGWIENKDWINEYELPGMPNKSNVGFADYVLFNDNGEILAVVEAKKTCVDVSKGRQQAKLYADLIEQKQSYRPIVFLSNGFDTRIIDNVYPERKVATIYSKRDLQKFLNLQKVKMPLNNIFVDDNIAGRYYQKAAIKSVCESFDKKNKRKALIVMATGAGKTRTVIALCKVLLDKGWARNILFLADRNSLVTQAKRSFTNLYPELSSTNLVEEKDNYTAHAVFSTYQTMINCIDTVNDDEGKLFTSGHFDLIICDEAHRSIYNKYRDIFNYFDASLVGLTATPKDEIDKNTYEIFELEKGVPTYGYDLAQAVKDGYLVDFASIEASLKFIDQGIVYDDLSDEDKATYEETFVDENGNLPEAIESSALNEWVFNDDTIKEVLNILMNNGIKVDYGNKIGKTIIFAKNHKHAEKIFEIFNKEYPHLNGYAKVIDNYINYAQSAIDEFSVKDKLPQIAISVDMLDTGIDVPEVVNLVFFKKVMSKSKFWQMIGRGTRLCPGLLDGKDKKEFFIFDFCGNFDFFRINKGRESASTMALQGAIFQLNFEMAHKLQEPDYQTDELKEYRGELVEYMVGKVNELNRDNFAVKQHLKYVDKYSEKINYEIISFPDTVEVKEELSPLIEPDNDDPKALRFDALIYGIELAQLTGEKHTKALRDLKKKVRDLSRISNVPDVMKQTDLINKILTSDYVDTAGIDDFEDIRKRLRDLIKYIPVDKLRYDTNFDDEILCINWDEVDIEDDTLINYKAKIESYILKNQDDAVIKKLKNNIPITKSDIDDIEKKLVKELGNEDGLKNELGDKQLGEFIRSITGMDMNAAKTAFSGYIDEASLNSDQIYFLDQIIDYIVTNGTMKDMSVLKDPPFTNQGSVSELFSDITSWQKIRSAIEQINNNAIAA